MFHGARAGRLPAGRPGRFAVPQRRPARGVMIRNAAPRYR